MRMHEVDVVLVYHPPDIAQPVRQAIHSLADELLLQRSLFHEGSFGIPMQFIQERVDLQTLRPEVKCRNIGMPCLVVGGLCKYLLPLAPVDMIQQGDELFLDQVLSCIWRQAIVDCFEPKQ